MWFLAAPIQCVEKSSKHILPNGGLFDGDESYVTNRKTSQKKQIQDNGILERGGYIQGGGSAICPIVFYVSIKFP